MKYNFRTEIHDYSINYCSNHVINILYTYNAKGASLIFQEKIFYLHPGSEYNFSHEILVLTTQHSLYHACILYTSQKPQRFGHKKIVSLFKLG